MQRLDLQVLEGALRWVKHGQTVWLCTVLSTYGSSPREPGAMLVAREDGKHYGSLSGGCVEDDFLEKIQQGYFSQPVQIIRYGANDSGVNLPCGGSLEVLIERFDASKRTLNHLDMVHSALLGHHTFIRNVSLTGCEPDVYPADHNPPPILKKEDKINVRVGPVRRLIISGISPVSEACASFAQTLGFDVIVCDPREEKCQNFSVPGVEVKKILPSSFIASGVCHGVTAVVALTHDPRIDDLAMMEAVHTEAFYIGVMGSKETSKQRAIRLMRSGGLTQKQVDQIIMPIGLNLGSKTPSEIALAVIADITRIYRRKSRHEL